MPRYHTFGKSSRKKVQWNRCNFQKRKRFVNFVLYEHCLFFLIFKLYLFDSFFRLDTPNECTEGYYDHPTSTSTSAVDNDFEITYVSIIQRKSKNFSRS